jgi:MoaA/NifB/PqqE/SkfB family radical SAM enzyme
MADKEFNLEKYLSDSVDKIIKEILKISLKNLAVSFFMARYALAAKRAGKLRREAVERGEHIPPFLIASITDKCNLYCQGCYARLNYAWGETEKENQLTDREWLDVFEQAENLGVGFILLAGGEPLLRLEVIKSAGKVRNILFPIFTNGTLLNDAYIRIFAKYRNLIPVLSIEGNEEYTDRRRGDGIYENLIAVMAEMHKHKIIYGASVTVTKENLEEITSINFLDKLYSRGCKAVFYVEYVPVSADTKSLEPEDAERAFLQEKLLGLRTDYGDMLFISFPGDEKESGGCLAAGRGFFHINSQGGAEPCPFSPYSDTNIKDMALREAINSPLFRKLRDKEILLDQHTGGCVLFEREETVRTLLNKEDG